MYRIRDQPGNARWGGATPSGSSGTASAAGTPASASGSSSNGPVSTASVFGNVGYDWVEYKMTIYYKYNHKTGKCTMRFEGAAAVEGMPSEMDCSAGAAADSPQVATPTM